MTLHDAPGGINSSHNTSWIFDSTSTSTSTSSTSTSSTSHSTSSTSTSMSVSSTSTSISSTSTSISSTSTSSTSTSMSSTSTSTSSTSTSLSTSSTSLSTSSTSSTSNSTSSSVSSTTLPPYTNQTITGMGVNYKSAQSRWQTDINYFKQIGLKYIRPHIPNIPIPWSAGVSDGNGNYAFWRLCAKTFAQAGFWVSWGPNCPHPITASQWALYHDAVVSEAAYLQSIGLILGDFELGNELESAIDNITLTITQLRINIRQLATDVKAVYNLSPISYACDNANNNYDGWIAEGLGSLDTISIHPYGNINVVKQTVAIGDFINVQKMMQAFGDRCYVSEFNLDASEPSIIQNLNVNAQITNMQSLLRTYLLNNNVPIFMIYLWSLYLNVGNNTATEYGFVQYRPDGSLNPMWYVFFTQQSSLTPHISGSPQPLVETPLDGFPNALVDDPVYLVDDPNVLTGSPTSQIGNQRTNSVAFSPKATIRKRN